MLKPLFLLNQAQSKRAWNQTNHAVKMRNKMVILNTDILQKKIYMMLLFKIKSNKTKFKLTP